MSEEYPSNFVISQKVIQRAEEVLSHLLHAKGVRDPEMALAVWEQLNDPPRLYVGREETEQVCSPLEKLVFQNPFLGAGYIFRGVVRLESIHTYKYPSGELFPTTTMLTTCFFPSLGGEERVLEFLRLQAQPPPRQRPTGPLPQGTFPELKALALALSDAPSGKNWEALPGELALVHIRPEFYTRLKADVLRWWGFELEEQSLWEVLHRLAPKGERMPAYPYVMGIYEVLGRLLEAEGRYVRFHIDDFVEALGLPCRTAQQRQDSRRYAYLLLRCYDNLIVCGVRRGVYRDRRSNDRLSLYCESALVRIMETRFHVQQTFDGSEIPLQVTLAIGPWAEPFLGDRRVLTTLGNIRRLEAIPTGKPAGALAQRLGLALHQLWREAASRAVIGRTGEEHRPTFRWRHVTRKELCELFPGPPDLEEILAGEHPHRAIEYWNQAIRILKEAPPVIGYYAEVDPPPQIKRGVGGWQEFWYSEQRLDIRPAPDLVESLAEINEQARRVRRKRKRLPKPPE